MRSFVFLLFFYATLSWSQTRYFLPQAKDTVSIQQAQFDFSFLEKPTTTLEKTQLIKELIKQLDTLSTYYFTGYENFADFENNLNDFAENLPYELQKNIHLVRINADSSYDFMYDRLDWQWDQQAIYVLLSTATGWKLTKLPGAIVLNMERDENEIVHFDTYHWACCDFPYDYYYHVQLKGDSIISKALTAFNRFDKLPTIIQFDSTKQVALKADSDVFAFQGDQMRKFYRLQKSVNVCLIDEKKLKDETYYCVRITLKEESEELMYCNFLIAWIHSNALN